MKSLYFLLTLIVVTMFFVITKSEDEDYYTTEPPNEEEVITTTTENALLRTGPEEYGKREQLDPNLTGLENFAILYLPKNLNYSNIIDAYREVKYGVRYHILTNATNEKNITIYCNLTVHEKPWLITPWEGRLRVLEKSNCSTIAEIKELNEFNHVDQALIDQAYQNNTIFNSQNKKLSKGTTLDDIEGMIIETKIDKNNQNMVKSDGDINTDNRNYDTTIESIIETTTSLVDSGVTNNVAGDLSTRNDNNNNNNNNNEEIQENFNKANQESSQQTNINDYTTEAPILTTESHHQTGNRVKLQTNLVGLENMALVYLPKQLTYTKIIEAYREVSNSIHYDILVQANRNDNSEIICDIHIQEKPWLLTPWGDKVRVLEKSNCSNSIDIMDINDRNHLDQATLDDKYKNNTLFNPTVQHVSDDLLDQIESMIVQPKNKRKQIVTNHNSHNSNYETTTRQYFHTTTRENINSRINANQHQQQQQQYHQQSQQQHQQQYQQQSQHQQQSQQNTAGLSRDDKEYLENFFNYFNIDNENISTTTGQENQASNTNHQQKHQHDNHLRSKRSPKKYNLKKSEHLFDKFQKKFDKNYETTFEKQKRYQIFKSNLLKINQLNKKEQGTAKYGLTEFADMTTTEYKMRTGLLYDPEDNNIGNALADIPNIELPKEFDWRTKNVITEVKNQGQCGSCWAFSVIGNIEGLHAIKTGKLEEYSEQELVDCDTIDKGCQGGYMDDAYKAVEKLGGLELESEYPYEAFKDKCKLNPSKIHIKIKGGLDLPKNETAMALWLVQNGPISIGVNANAMMFYRGGISHPWSLLCRKGGLDHGVLIVGFGVAEFPLFNKTLPYWIIKNSWGKRWGEQGYYRLYRGDNSCGVNSMATSAILE